ncbi:AraC family transcriptional regulator [Paenibacillus mucilaginosus]|uniref:AraC family transcriptional regulator n=1 Tax=Paenibacillus mucilaginosus K02 TaxID=997761 RepID=I0BQT2_9BACL|nr:AraC family transcriptional regulator [Paenibacillus mucilaginosus]AFH64729.1 AraC family transcriptional regulator [Paenibacillus mucilaginosus K02]MCG7215565.1 AraC family transcriptional regulator [Paenibacillus mucilaginosus]WDM26194.1 helix-turn-helix transcriptional regulator [Paenibacillus mucilaginosus]WFA20902.1 AraC family transcriptional regulator [Paenibacillus mucilaginosus]
MNFQQLLGMIPIPRRIESCSASQTLLLQADEHVLLIVRRGHVTVAAPGREAAVVAQAFACHPTAGPWVIQVPRTKEAEYAVIRYGMLPEHSEWTLEGTLHTVSEVKIHYMIDELLRTCDAFGPEPLPPEEEAAQRFRMRLMLERILFICLYESQAQTEKHSSAEAIEETLSYINEHYMLKLTLPMLARRAGMSGGHYTVLFKRHTGMTLTAYLHRLRIEKARQLFLQTDLPAKEIALRVGFADYFHFSKTFKKVTGTAPSVFLQQTSKNQT